MAKRRRRRRAGPSRRKFLGSLAKGAMTAAVGAPVVAALAGRGRFNISSGLPDLKGDIRPKELLGRIAIVRAKTDKRLRVVNPAADDPYLLTRRAVGALGGMEKFVSRGDHVIVKPNIGWALLPEFAATTNPDVVRAVAEMCLEAGASRVTLTDNPCNDPDETFHWSGMEDIPRRIDGAVECRRLRSGRFKRIPFRLESSGSYRPRIDDWPVNTDFLRADKIINVPVAKHHTHTLVTMTMKNCYGFLGEPREKLHQIKNESVAEMAAFMALRGGMTLNILDGYRVMTEGGPTGGSRAYVQKRRTIIAGADPVAVDAAGTELLFNLKRFRGRLGMKRTDLPFLSMGRDLGLGTPEWDTLEGAAVIEV